MATGATAVEVSTNGATLLTTDTYGRNAFPKVWLSNRATNAADLGFNVSELQATGEYVGLQPGMSIVVELPPGSVLTAKTSTGTNSNVIDYGIIGRARPS